MELLTQKPESWMYPYSLYNPSWYKKVAPILPPPVLSSLHQLAVFCTHCTHRNKSRHKHHHPIMNGIKKALSHRRTSTTSSGSDDAAGTHSSANTTPETSPRQQTNHKLMGDSTATRKEPVVTDGTGLGRSQAVVDGEGGKVHSHGHNANVDPSSLEGGDVSQETKFLGHATEETKHKHTIEEVQRQRELHRHHHHVQHHRQEVLDTHHDAEQQHAKVIPQTQVHEKHASSDKDAALLDAVVGKHSKDKVAQGVNEHQIVDKGELVNEHTHHHVTNLITPVIVKDSHEHHRVKTTIPVHEVQEHAPVVHESIQHKPISKEEFLRTGGVLGSKLTTGSDGGFLHDGKCERTVDGVGEKLAKDLNLGNTSTTTSGQAL